MRKLAIFAVVSLGAVTIVAWISMFAFPTPADHHAIIVSAGIAYVVQLCTFSVARYFAKTNVMAGWGLGMLLRFGVLAIYALGEPPLSPDRIAAFVCIWMAVILFIGDAIKQGSTTREARRMALLEKHAVSD